MDKIFFGFPFTSNNTHNKTNLSEQIEIKKTDLLKLLRIPNILNELKQQKQEFNKLIMTHPQYLLQLINCSFRPEMYFNKDIQNQSRIPYIALEILCSGEQEMIEFLFSKKEITIIQMKQQQNQNLEKLDLPLIKYIFQFLKSQNKINETSAGYLLKFINSFSYQKPEQFLKLVSENQWIKRGLINHLYSRSIINIVQIIMCLNYSNLKQSENDILNAKHQLIKQIIINIKEECVSEVLEQKLENLNLLMNDLKEKSHQKYEGETFIPILKLFIELENIKIIKMLAQKSIVSNILQRLAEFINIIIIFSNVNNLNSYASTKDFQIEQSVFEQIFQIIKIIHKKIYFSLKNPGLSLKMQFFTLISSLYKKNSKLTKEFFNQQFIRDSINLMKQHPFNNIMHRIQQQIFIFAIRTDDKFNLCKKSIGFMDFIIQQLSRKQRVENGYINQLFHICSQIIDQSQKNQQFKIFIQSQFNNQFIQFLNKVYNPRKQTYERLLAGQNPRIKSQSCIEKQQNQIELQFLNENQIQKEFTDRSDNMNKNPWFNRTNTNDQINQYQIQNINLEIQSDQQSSSQSQNQLIKPEQKKIQLEQKKSTNQTQKNFPQQNSSISSSFGFFNINKYWAIQLYHNLEDLILQL